MMPEKLVHRYPFNGITRSWRVMYENINVKYSPHLLTWRRSGNSIAIATLLHNKSKPIRRTFLMVAELIEMHFYSISCLDLKFEFLSEV